MTNTFEKNRPRAAQRRHPYKCPACQRIVGLREVHWNREATPGIDGKMSLRIPRHMAEEGRWCTRGGEDAL